VPGRTSASSTIACATGSNSSPKWSTGRPGHSSCTLALAAFSWVSGYCALDGGWTTSSLSEVIAVASTPGAAGAGRLSARSVREPAVAP
jgi:hypothetical protein